MAKAEAAAAAVAAADPRSARKRRVRREATRLFSASGDTEPTGLVLAGDEFERARLDTFDPVVLDAVTRLARLAASLCETLGSHPDGDVRRSVALLAARAHPLLLGLDEPNA
ncbi:MAG: hypothetical protein NVSMB2_04890 [Chloroflexota bacterium]